MNKKFDKKINQKISQTEISPSTDLWSKIEAELPEERKKGTFFLIPLFASPVFKQAIAASVMFLLGGMSVYYFSNKDIATQQITEQNTIINTDINQNVGKNASNDLNTNINENALAKEEANLIIEEKTKNNSTQNTKRTLNSNNTLNTNNSSTKIINTSYYAKNSNTYAKAYFNPIIKINNGVEETTSQNMKVSDYDWVYDQNTGAYAVVLKTNIQEKTNTNGLNNSLFAEEKLINNELEEDLPSYMSIIEKKEEEKLEVLETTEEEPVLKAFTPKKLRLNYKGFWLGPQVGFEGIFVGDDFYSGASFGIDAGYDFGAWGLQSGIKYALNSKTIQIIEDGSLVNYKSEFNSIHVPLYARYKFTSLRTTNLNAKPISLNLIAGFDYAYADQKKMHQLGINLGAEYDIFTQADLMFTLGMKGGIYNNLNKNRIEFKENVTRYNYMLNAYISVRFIDWVKKSE